MICLTYCPTLFVVGENASDYTPESMRYLRKNMLIDTGLIEVGSANGNLFVSQLRLNLERVSQKCVDRRIVEHTMEFIKQVIDDLGPLNRECKEMLKPVELINIYEVDPAALKCKNPHPVSSKAKKSLGLSSSSSMSVGPNLIRFDKKYVCLFVCV